MLQPNLPFCGRPACRGICTLPHAWQSLFCLAFFLNFGHMFGKPYLYPQLCWILGLWIDQVIIKVCNLGDLCWKWKDNDVGPLTLLYPSISFSWITSVPFPMFLSLCPRLIDLTVRQCLVSLNWTGNGMWCPPSFLLFRTLSYPFDQPKDVVSLKRQDSTLLLTGNWSSGVVCTAMGKNHMLGQAQELQDISNGFENSQALLSLPNWLSS